ncbi:DUF6074 family protein [Mesorhizobium sp.]|uniref:DUF6074 family protein n=1 Tax=Mesorhizobium sp. TaxID=1871066 RepID=UPI000FEAB180|nr:DUF6074 family protein [Mesorhizobium sp.]RWE29792.1 MAG: hypothetical protein EOS77_21820 [Mesorhizobium sp.]
MGDGQLDLLAWKPSPQVIVFPLARRLEKVRRVANLLSKKHGKDADIYWKNTVRGLFEQLQRAGIAETVIADEVRQFQDAVQLELRQRAFIWSPQGGDAA